METSFVVTSHLFSRRCRCFPVFLGGSAHTEGLASAVNKRCTVFFSSSSGDRSKEVSGTKFVWVCALIHQMSFDHSRTCDQLRCTDCDFKVSTFDNFQWKKDTDYLFLRNNMPDFDRLRSKLMPKKGTCLVPPVRSLEPPPGFLFFRPREAASQGGLSESCTCRRRDTPDGEHVTALTCGPNANELLLLLFQVYVRTLVSVSGNRWPSWKRLIQVTNGFVGNTDNERNHKTVNCYCSCKMSTWSQPTTR